MTQTATPRPFRFTGWHITTILVAFFGVVFAVNFYMARLATTTFSGEVVENSYDASQVFNKWLDQAAKEKALGWNAHVARQADGRLAVEVTGAGTQTATITGEAWRPLGASDAIRAVTFTRQGGDKASTSYVSQQALGDGRWYLRLTLSAGGKQWHSQAAI